ncbi:hypothetical protein COO60DRAFT_1672788 [Scenedesmus sp. NREL 46B-D3]|nr:hypothetical protein COO60DRAFT_1672788 [Scenedesmus sp. NREL 46B-D3]
MACRSTHDESVLLAAAGSSVGSWAYKGGAWRVLHTFKATITCMQQSATETRVLAIGCADCSLHLYDLLLHKVVCTVSLGEGVVPCDVQFDPLSKQYLLLLCRNGSMALYGISGEQHALSQVFALAKQPAAERAAAFVPSQPGNFISISKKTGVLQLWNVSQQQPLKSLKIGKGPAQSVQFFPGSSKALLTFQDGTVMAYDVASQDQLWSTQPGHTETIFDCCMHPVDPRLLATCSYDGSVRVWDVGSGSCLKTLDVPNSACRESQPVALYSVSWSLDGSQLAASGADGAVYLYDYAKGIAVKRWQLHTQTSLKVAWHPVDAGLLASSSMDGSVVAFRTDGTKVKVLRHAGSTSGLAWHPTNAFQLATTSEAGTVHVWDLKRAGNDCLVQTLTGHGKRSFSVAWSPLLPQLLLSGSDDATARVWDVQTGTCAALLLGHVTEVRALCWHPEVPWLVFTGSWDSTIRAWDIRSRACLHVCNHHHGDVYGLSIHPARPFAMVSASRDTTLRLWDLKGLTAGLLPRCCMDGALPRGQVEAYMTHHLHLMCGQTSEQVAEWAAKHLKANGSSSLAGLSVPARVEMLRRLSELFSAPGPASTMWQLAAAAATHLARAEAGSDAGSGLDDDAAAAAALMQRAFSSSNSLLRSGSGAGVSSSSSLIRPLPAKDSCGFQHVAAARLALVSAANQLELSVRGSGPGKSAMGAAKQDEALQEAALLHLQAGQAERCCELLVEAGEWDRALVLAPAVSQQYWAKLLRRRADVGAKRGAGARQLLPLLLAAGQAGALAELLLAQKQFELAASEPALLGGRRNSLPPLRGVVITSCSGTLQPCASTGALCATAAGLDRSGSFGLPSSPGSARPASPSPPAAAAAAAEGLGGCSSSRCTDDVVLKSPSGCIARMRGGGVGLGGGAAGSGARAADGAAMQQLAAVRDAQAVTYRRQGQPLLAACAALTVDDVAGAVSALHLGHEPEQAAMLCLALGELGGVGAGLQDRVFAALGSKCEAAGDWEAAAAAVKLLSRDVGHHLQLLVVRAERASRHSRPGRAAAAAAAAAEGQGAAAPDACQVLRQRLGLLESSQYAALAAATSDPLESTRGWLLAGDHSRAAAKASTYLVPLLESLQQRTILHPTDSSLSTSSSKESHHQQPQLVQLPEVHQLLLWQGCLDSFDAPALAGPCWQEMFAYNLLAGALRAFVYGYVAVGSFLMTCLKRWLEQHQVKFPLCRGALLVLEASAVAGSSPETACSLLIAAADSRETPANVM